MKLQLLLAATLVLGLAQNSMACEGKKTTHTGRFAATAVKKDSNVKVGKPGYNRRVKATK